MLNVQTDCGAIGGNNANDTAAFQQIISRLSPNPGGLAVIPAGTYLIDNPLVILGPHSPIFVGEGPMATTLIAMNPTQPLFWFGGGIGFNPVRWGGIENMQLRYASEASVDTEMIRLRNVKGFHMRDVWMRGYRMAFKIGNNADGLAASCEDVHLERIKADPAAEAWHGGGPVSRAVMMIENVNGLWITNCSLSGVHNQLGYLFSCEGQVTVDTVTVVGSLMKDCMYGLRAGDGTASNVIFSASYLDKCQHVGVLMETRPDRELKNWQFDGLWINSAGYGYLCDTRSGGKITRMSRNGGTVEAAILRHDVGPAGTLDIRDC